MGQYYLLVNLRSRQAMSVLADGIIGGLFTSGQKMCEQLDNLGRKPFLALALLATAPLSEMPGRWGSWAGGRVVLIGDYSDDVDERFLTELERAELESDEDEDAFVEVSDDPDAWFAPMKDEQLMERIAPRDGHHAFVNMDKEEYLDPVAFGSEPHTAGFMMERDGIMRALYSCLFFSTGRGGGDIKALLEGRWAGDRLQLVDIQEAKRRGYADVSADVNELLGSFSP